MDLQSVLALGVVGDTANYFPSKPTGMYWEVVALVMKGFTAF